VISAFLRLPVVSEGADCLAMGYVMRRNTLAHKAPLRSGGYDLICIHPDPRHQRDHRQQAQARVQVRRRYATDCDRGFPVKEKTLDAFGFPVMAFLDTAELLRGNEGVKHHRDGTSPARLFLETIPAVGRRVFRARSRCPECNRSVESRPRAWPLLPGSCRRSIPEISRLDALLSEAGQSHRHKR
jgi:hypothetical protein